MVCCQYVPRIGGGWFRCSFPLIKAATRTAMVDMTVNFKIQEGCSKSYWKECENALKLQLVIPSANERATRCFPTREGCCVPCSPSKDLTVGEEGVAYLLTEEFQKDGCLSLLLSRSIFLACGLLQRKVISNLLQSPSHSVNQSLALLRFISMDR